jgi:hypothetical protein
MDGAGSVPEGEDVAREDGLDWHDDEVLPEPSDRDWALLRRIRRPIGALAVVALLAWGVAELTFFTDSTTSAVVSATTAPASPERWKDSAGISLQVNFPVARTAAGIVTNDGVGVLCPPSNPCTATRLLPPDAEAAVRAVFPSMRISAAVTIVHRDVRRGLRYRSIHATSPGREIDINIVPVTPGDHADSGAIQDGAGVQVYTHRLLAGYLVQVRVHFADHVPHPISALRGLPSDHRLLALT